MGIFPPHPSLPPSHKRKAEAVERNRNGNKAGIVLKNHWLQPTHFMEGITDTRMNPSFCFNRSFAAFSGEGVENGNNGTAVGRKRTGDGEVALVCKKSQLFRVVFGV